MQATIGNRTYPVQFAGWQPGDRLASRRTLSFEVRETDAVFFQAGEEVALVDPTSGTVFNGFVESNEMHYLSGTQMRSHVVTCKSEEYLADKRYVTKPNRGNRYAGDYALDMLNDYLTDEGVTARASLRHDKDTTSFAQGVLTNVIAENDGLTLSHDGVPFTVVENTGSILGTGTLTDLQANSNNTLTLAAFQALQLMGTCIAPETLVSYTARKIWSGSQSVASGDELLYGVWSSSTSPDDIFNVELGFSDYSTLTSIGNIVDQYGIAATGASLSGNAKDTWFERSIDISAAAGKTITSVRVQLQGSKPGDYAAWFRHIRLIDSVGALKADFFAASLQRNIQIGSSGYEDVTLVQVTAYEKQGERVSPSYPNTICNSVQRSVVTWQEDLPSQVLAQGGSEVPLSIAVSLDGGGYYYASSTNGQEIPGLLPGADITNSFARFRILMQNLGNNPTYTPVLSNLALTINPGYYQAVTEIVDTDATQSDFGTGTLSNVTNYSNGLMLTGSYKDWHDGSLVGHTLRGTGNPSQSIFLSALRLQCDTGHEVRSQFVFAGQWQNFICEMDILLASNSTTSGIVYRTTNWGGNDNTFAYLAYISPTAVVLGYGSNSNSSPTWTEIISVAASLQVGNWYRVRVEVTGNSHKVYVDDALYINQSNSVYTEAGDIGARFSNTSGVTKYGLFGNFGVVAAMSGTRTNPSLNLSSAVSVSSSFIQWSSVEADVTSVLVEASFNGGGSWASCANNAPIPGLSYGQSLSGISLLIRETLATNNASTSPRLYALTVRVVGQTTNSATRISYPLIVSNVGQVDSTAVTWDVVQPSLTTFAVKTSIDGQKTWQTIANSGDPIPGIQVGGADYLADMHLNDAGNWMSTCYSGGSDATWEWDSDNFLLAARDGTNAVYACLPTGTVDSAGDLIVSRSDDGGILIRYADINNHYRIILHDDLSVSNPQTITLYKRVSGTNTQLAQVAISFLRGEFHHFAWNITGSTIKLYWNGNLVATTADSAITTCSRSSALFNGSGTAWWHVFRSQPFGESIAGTFTLSSDSFTRSISGAWGTASDGIDVWSIVSGSPTLNVSSNVGTLAATGGSTVYMRCGVISTTDVDIYCDLKKPATNDFIGILARFSDVNNWYRLAVGGGQVMLHRKVAGTQTLLTSVSMAVTNDIFYTARLKIEGSTISFRVWQTGTSEPSTWLYEATDTALVFGGYGVYANPASTGVALSCDNFNVYSQNCIFTLVNMSTNDASTSSILKDLTISVRSKDIQAGAWISTTSYQHKNTCASALEDLAKKSDFIWSISNRVLTFQGRPIVFAPWPLASINLDIMIVKPPALKSYAPLYRNRQFITGAFDTVAIVGEEHRGDSSATSWTLAYPVYSKPSIEIDGIPQTVGVAGIEVDKQFYWAYGSPTISQNQNQPKLTQANVLNADYTGLVDYVAQADNISQQHALKQLEGGSGIIEAIESCDGLLKDAANQLAEARLNQYAILSLEWEFRTTRAGLKSGMILYTYVFEMDVNNVAFLLTSVDPDVLGAHADGTPYTEYACKATSGPPLSSWSALFRPLGE